MVWACDKIGQSNQSNTTGNSRRQAKKRWTEKEVDWQHRGVGRQNPSQSQAMAHNRHEWRELTRKSNMTRIYIASSAKKRSLEVADDAMGGGHEPCSGVCAEYKDNETADTDLLFGSQVELICEQMHFQCRPVSLSHSTCSMHVPRAGTTDSFCAECHPRKLSTVQATNAHHFVAEWLVGPSCSPQKSSCRTFSNGSPPESSSPKGLHASITTLRQFLLNSEKRNISGLHDTEPKHSRTP